MGCWRCSASINACTVHAIVASGNRKGEAATIGSTGSRGLVYGGINVYYGAIILIFRHVEALGLKRLIPCAIK